MAKKTQQQVIKELQGNPEFIILNNPLSTPKFVRKIGKRKDITTSEVYTPKIFYDIISKLTPTMLEGVGDNESVLLNFDIGEFLRNAGTDKSKSLYGHVIECLDLLQTTQMKWDRDKDTITSVTVISKFHHYKKTGKADLRVDAEFAKKVLEVTHQEHFSFLKKQLFRLQSGQAIKLFPFLVSWKNRGRVDMQLEAFKQKFGYDTVGYEKFSNLKIKVLDPALQEINEKTDLIANYELIGDSLESKKPRVTGLRFFIHDKTKQRQLTNGTTRKGLFDVPADPGAPLPATTPPPPGGDAVAIRGGTNNALMQEFGNQAAEKYGVGAEAFGKAIEGKTKEDVLQAMEAVEERRKKGGMRDSGGLFLKALKDGYKSADRVKKEVREAKQKQSVETMEIVRQLEKQKAEARTRRRDAVGVIIKAMTAANPKIAEELKEKADDRNAMLRKYTVEDLRKPEHKKWRDMFIEEFVKEYPDVFGSVVSEFDEQIKKIEVEIEKIKGVGG